MSELLKVLEVKFLKFKSCDRKICQVDQKCCLYLVVSYLHDIYFSGSNISLLNTNIPMITTTQISSLNNLFCIHSTV